MLALDTTVETITLTAIIRGTDKSCKRVRRVRNIEDDPLIALIEGEPLYEHPAPKAASKPEAASATAASSCCHLRLD